MTADFMTYDDVMQKLESLASHDPKDLAGMARFGIRVDKAWVISIPKLRNLAKEIRNEYKRIPGLRPGMTGGEQIHELALQLWDSDVHEARILAGFIDEPELVTEEQMEKWVLGFDSWDVTDLVCTDLFDRTEFAVKKAIEWSEREEEFVKRAGFVIMAGLSVHDKTMPDSQFLEFLEIIKRESTDNRNFVRKAVNWALRQIGKSRNESLYCEVLKACDEIEKIPGLRPGMTDQEVVEARRAARFIAGDAKRELQKDYIKRRFGIE